MTFPAHPGCSPETASTIDIGTFLGLARQALGLDAAVVARRLAMSTRQVQEIEEGGLSAFYSEAHKRLAIRKYADFLGCGWPPQAGAG